jgi:putative ABC transport system substrate-binding protein
MKTRVHLAVGILTLGLLVVTLPSGCGRGNAKPKVAIFNLQSHPILDDSIKGIKAELADEGFGPDRVEYIEVNANGDMNTLNAFSNELLTAHPNVIIPVSTPVTQAVAKEARPTQKIVFSTVTNPSDVGMDKEPANMTGVCDVVNYKANFDLIFELFPKTKRIGIIYNAGERNSQYGVEQIKPLAKKRSVELKLVTVSQSQEVIDAVRSLVGNVDVIYVGSDNTVVSAMGGLTQVAYGAKLPVVASDSGSVEEGALAAVSVDYEKLGRRVGKIVANILETDQMPSDTSPVMYLGDHLILNEKAAKRLNIDFTKDVLTRAKRIVGK